MWAYLRFKYAVCKKGDWDGSTIGPGAAETATSFVGSGVSESHGR